MAGEPTFAELANMSTLGEVAAWAELEGDGNDVTMPLGSFLALLGATETTMPRILGIVKEATLDVALGAWTIGGAPPSIIQMGAADLLVQACCFKCGTKETKAASDAKALAIAVASTPPVAALAAPKGRTIKLNLVCSQVDESDVDIVDEAFMLVAHARYLRRWQQASAF